MMRPWPRRHPASPRHASRPQLRARIIGGVRDGGARAVRRSSRDGVTFFAAFDDRRPGRLDCRDLTRRRQLRPRRPVRHPAAARSNVADRARPEIDNAGGVVHAVGVLRYYPDAMNSRQRRLARQTSRTSWKRSHPPIDLTSDQLPSSLLASTAEQGIAAEQIFSARRPRSSASAIPLLRINDYRHLRRGLPTVD